MRPAPVHLHPTGSGVRRILKNDGERDGAKPEGAIGGPLDRAMRLQERKLELENRI